MRYFFILLVLLMGACGASKIQFSSDRPESMNDIIGTYEAQFIKLGGETWKSNLTLRTNNTYTYEESDLNNNHPVLRKKGRVEYGNKKEICALKDGDNVLFYFKREQNILEECTEKGKILKRYNRRFSVKRNDNELTNKYWKLIELRGQKISSKNMDKEAHVQFKTQESMATGNSGCNQFSGKFEILSDNRFRVYPLLRTEMYCEKVPWENDFFEALENSEGYHIKNDTLQIFKAKMAPSAIFVAVYF